MLNLNKQDFQDKQDFQEWINAFLKDLKQIFNSPWISHELRRVSQTHASTINSSYETGLNFLANASVLISLEFVARLASGEKDGRKAVVTFVKDYFPNEYSRLINLVWTLFRNGHAHNFLTNRIVIDDKTIEGIVVWIDPSPEIENFEANIKTSRSEVFEKNNLSRPGQGHLDFVQESSTNYCLYLYPQIVFIDLVIAIEKWRQKIKCEPRVDKLFSKGISMSEKARSIKQNSEQQKEEFLKIIKGISSKTEELTTE